MTDSKISIDLPALLCVSDEIIICGGKKNSIISSATLSIVTTSKIREISELSGGVEYLTDHISYITHIISNGQLPPLPENITLKFYKDLESNHHALILKRPFIDFIRSNWNLLIKCFKVRKSIVMVHKSEYLPLKATSDTLKTLYQENN